MPRQFVLECLVELPDDAHDLAETIAKTRAPWTALTEALGASAVKFQQKSEIMEVRAKALPRTERRGRKPKAQPVPQPDLPEAA